MKLDDLLNNNSVFNNFIVYRSFYYASLKVLNHLWNNELSELIRIPNCPWARLPFIFNTLQ